MRLIYELAGRPSLEKWTLAGPAYTLSVEGTAVLFALGARIVGPDGVDSNAMEHLLGTDSRNPAAKHRIVEMWVDHGFEPPDTPLMALHRGRIDLLGTHLARDPDLFTRTFGKSDIYPLAPACAREPYTGQGTPVDGTTLLHIAAYFDELEIAEWLLDRGMDRTRDRRSTLMGSAATRRSTRRSSVSVASGSTTARVSPTRRVSRICCWTVAPTPTFAHRCARASKRATVAGRCTSTRDVTPLGWGEQFHAPVFVSRGGASVDRVERRWSMSLSEICYIFRTVSDAAFAFSPAALLAGRVPADALN